MRKPVFLCGVVLAAVFFLPTITGAPATGAVSLPQRMPNGKVCRTNLYIDAHVHGANGAHPDKTQAQLKAIRDWSRFTIFEYGRRWGHWPLALDHKMICMHDTDAGVWRCRAEAQPCKDESREGTKSSYRPRAGGCSSLLSLSCIQRIVKSTLVW